MASDSSSSLRPGVLHISLQIRKAQPRGWKKRTNEQTRTWVSSKRKKGEVYLTLCILRANVSVYSNEILTSYKQCWYLLALVNPVSVGQQVLAVVFLTSVDSVLCPASIFSLLPSANCVLLWAATSSQLFSYALLVNWLSLSSLGLSFPPPLSVSREISPSDLLCGFCAKTDKEILWPAPIQTEMNTTYCVTNLQWLIWHKTKPNQILYI